MVKLVQVLSLTESKFSNVSHLLDLKLFESLTFVEKLGSKLSQLPTGSWSWNSRLAWQHQEFTPHLRHAYAFRNAYFISIRPKLHKSYYFGWTQPRKNLMIKSPLQCCVDFSLKLNVNEITKSFKTFDWKLNFRLCKNLKIRAKSKFYHTLHLFKFFHGPKLIMWMRSSWMMILFKFKSFKI